MSDAARRAKKLRTFARSSGTAAELWAAHRFNPQSRKA